MTIDTVSTGSESHDGSQEPGAEAVIRGRTEGQDPQDHILRVIKASVDFPFVHKIARSFCSHTGAPSVGPIVIFKMSLIGYIYNIPSERRLADECRLNMAFL
jgi:hypothetical protein